MREKESDLHRTRGNPKRSQEDSEKRMPPPEGNATGCVFQWESLTWDLRDLMSASYTLQVLDDSETPFETQFHVALCDTLASSIVDPSCESTFGSAGEKLTEAQSAYQVVTNNKGSSLCYRCGLNASWALTNSMSPTQGVSLTYYGGNSCPATSPTLTKKCDFSRNGYTTYCRRSFTLNFLCDDSAIGLSSDKVTRIDTLREETGCSYVATLSSKYGCPLQCPRNHGVVCSGRGVCAFESNGGGGCDCDRGYSGPACDQPVLAISHADHGFLLGFFSASSLLLLLFLLYQLLLLFLQKKKKRHPSAPAIERELSLSSYDKDDQNPFLVPTPAAEQELVEPFDHHKTHHHRATTFSPPPP